MPARSKARDCVVLGVGKRVEGAGKRGSVCVCVCVCILCVCVLCVLCVRRRRRAKKTTMKNGVLSPHTLSLSFPLSFHCSVRHKWPTHPALHNKSR